jgi:hypothetical protein
MFSTPLICCSIGVTTVAATTSALAPGYWPVTLIKGGAISGYCAIGRRENDTPPRITKTIEITAAKIGRSMKKCERRMPFIRLRLIGVLARRRRRGGRALLLRRDLHAVARAHQALTITRSEAARPSLITRKPSSSWAGVTYFNRATLPSSTTSTYLRDCSVPIASSGNEQRRVGRRAGYAQAAEHAGREQAAGIVEHRAAADRARRAVDDVVDEIHLAGVLEVRLVDQLERDRDAALAARHLRVRSR